MNTANIPAELKTRPQWVVWRTEKRNDKPTKVPYAPKTGAKAKSDTPSTWATFATALTAYDNGKRYDGMGYVFSGADDDFTGIDLDKCASGDGQFETWATDIVAAMDSYTETSPSGRGLHIILKGKLPDGGRRKGKIEMYDSGRYFTVTGDLWPDAPATIESRQAELDGLHARVFGAKKEQPEPRQPSTASGTLDDATLLRKAMGAKGGAKFSQLWSGDFSGYPSQSEADLSLCGKLVFWTGGDTTQTDRLFRQSGLMRPKWDKRHHGDGRTYGEGTIQEAIRGTTEFYNPRRIEQKETADLPPEPEWDEQPQTVEESTAPPPTPAAWGMLTLADAYAPRDPLFYVVADLFCLPSLSIVYGAPGCLKSMLLADMALCVAGGLPWLPSLPDARKPVSARETTLVPVLWCDFDNGTRRTHERIEALARARDLDPEATPFYYVSMPTPWLDGNSPMSVSGLTELANSQNVGLIVIDNLGAVSGDADENSAGMVQVLANFRLLAERTTAAVVIVHHQRKSTGFNARAGESLRGHSSIEAALDLALLVQRDEGAAEVAMQSTKTRGTDVLPFGAVFAFDHRTGTKELERAQFYGMPVVDNRKPARAQRAILEAVDESETPPNKSSLVRLAQGIYETGVNYYRDVIDLLVNAGDLVESEGKKNAKFYSLPV